MTTKQKLEPTPRADVDVLGDQLPGLARAISKDLRDVFWVPTPCNIAEALRRSQEVYVLLCRLRSELERVNYYARQA